MSAPTKIATCCYCQARVIINVAAGSRHELVCTSCGAPITETEIVKAGPAPATPPPRTEGDQPPRERRDDREKHERKERYKDDRKSRHKKYDRDRKQKYDKGRHKRDRKRRPRGIRYWLHKVWDEIVDFFD